MSNPIVAMAALAVRRQAVYPGAGSYGEPIPKFDKGYLLHVAMQRCAVRVHAPGSGQGLNLTLKGPGGMPCSALNAAVDNDGRMAVSISYSTAVGYAGGIVRLDKTGKQTAFIETGRFVPSHIGFDRRQTLWAIGWQRDEIRNDTADSHDYFLVRRYSQAGVEDGAFIPRSLWKTRGEPAGGSSGYWHMAFADDRIGATIYENWAHRTAEWIEWDFDGKLLSRIPLGSRDLDGGRAFTSKGELYGGFWTANAWKLFRLDRDARRWMPVTEVAASELSYLMGADGDNLVFKARYGTGEYAWMKLIEP